MARHDRDRLALKAVLLRVRELSVQQPPLVALFLEPHPRPAIAGVANVQKDYTGSVKGPLNGVQGRAARIHDLALGIFDRDLGDAGSGGELALFPAEKGTCCAYLFSRNHRKRIGHNGSFRQQKGSAFG
jgi:hypothetical protein